MTLPKIVVLGMGGTIAGVSPRPGDDRHYLAGQVPVAQLTESLPGAPVPARLMTEQVAQIDSKDIEPALWWRLRARVLDWLAKPDVAGVVITHGTDTLEETAYFLSATVSTDKPVVLTCAMRPATSTAPDGPRNLRDALTVALTPGARGVVVVCAGEVHSAREVQKHHTQRLDAFVSGNRGPLGAIVSDRFEIARDWPTTPDFSSSGAIENIVNVSMWPRVDIVTSHAGADGRVVDALVAHGVDGLVVAGTGNGTLHSALADALWRASASGVAVWISTRCAQGGVNLHDDSAWPGTGDLNPVKARIALALELMGWSAHGAPFWR